MFLAHLPVGSLVAHALSSGAPRAQSRMILVASLVGSVLPDVDMLWFHLVDHGRVHHHRYWTHVPLFWAALALPLLVAVARLWPAPMRAVVAFFIAIGSHLVLDTVVGDIQWLQPISDRFVHLVTVESIEGEHWIWSFVLHWTFAVEIALLVVAIAVAVRARRLRRSSATA